MQAVPARRRRMLAALPSSVEADPEKLPQEDLQFFSTKVLSAEACTACSICVAVCPTGALQAPRNMREIRFDTSRCTKCKLCDDVCEPNAITVAAESSLLDFLDFAPRMLSRLAVASCRQWGQLPGLLSRQGKRQSAGIGTMRDFMKVMISSLERCGAPGSCTKHFAKMPHCLSIKSAQTRKKSMPSKTTAS
jgi:Pyruvate/2-oxoacid:ferredoxin oxidoreductase delta subunit